MLKENVYTKFSIRNPKNTLYTQVLTLFNLEEKTEEKSMAFDFIGIHYYYMYYYMHH